MFFVHLHWHFLSLNRGSIAIKEQKRIEKPIYINVATNNMAGNIRNGGRKCIYSISTKKFLFPWVVYREEVEGKTNILHACYSEGENVGPKCIHFHGWSCWDVIFLTDSQAKQKLESFTILFFSIISDRAFCFDAMLFFIILNARVQHTFQTQNGLRTTDA